MTFQNTTDVLYAAVGKDINLRNYDTNYPKKGVITAVNVNLGGKMRNDIVTITYCSGASSYTVQFAYSPYFTRLSNGFKFNLPWCPSGTYVEITGF